MTTGRGDGRTTLGIAITGAILAAREGAAVAHGTTNAAGFVDGFHTGLYVSAGVMIAGAAIALSTLRNPVDSTRITAVTDPA